MPNSPLPSPIANMTRARQQMSAIRQSLSLEPSAASMRSVAPAGQPQSPADNPGAAQQAMTAPPPQMENPDQPVQIPPEVRQEMLGKIQGFLDEHGPEQQALIDQQRSDPPIPGVGGNGGSAGNSVRPPTYGDDYVDAPTGSKRAMLEANRGGESQYGAIIDAIKEDPEGIATLLGIALAPGAASLAKSGAKSGVKAALSDATKNKLTDMFFNIRRTMNDPYGLRNGAMNKPGSTLGYIANADAQTVTDTLSRANGGDDNQMVQGGYNQQIRPPNGHDSNAALEGEIPAAPAQVIKEPKILRALEPLSTFFKENGRLPTADELQHLAAARELQKTLGRKPTETEVNLYRAKPNSLK